MAPAGSFIDDSPLTTDLYCSTAVSLDGCHELDAAVTVPMVVPVDERGDPLAGLLFGGKWLAGVIMPIFHRPEQGFRVGVVVGYSWP
jgi:hypothetical protein